MRPIALNANIRSISAPLLPELLPSESGLYDVLVLEKIVSKSISRASHDFSASNRIDSLSPSIYGSSKDTFSLSQFPIWKACSSAL